VIDFYVINDTGVVVSVMRGPQCLLDDAVANNPGRVFEGVADVGQVRGADGALLTKASAPTYAELRRAAYPEIGDQLDAIWKLLASAKEIPAEAAMILQQIAEVKASIPKDQFT